MQPVIGFKDDRVSYNKREDVAKVALNLLQQFAVKESGGLVVTAGSVQSASEDFEPDYIRRILLGLSREDELSAKIDDAIGEPPKRKVIVSYDSRYIRGHTVFHFGLMKGLDVDDFTGIVPYEFISTSMEASATTVKSSALERTLHLLKASGVHVKSRIGYDRMVDIDKVGRLKVPDFSDPEGLIAWGHKKFGEAGLGRLAPIFGFLNARSYNLSGALKINRNLLPEEWKCNNDYFFRNRSELMKKVEEAKVDEKRLIDKYKSHLGSYERSVLRAPRKEEHNYSRLLEKLKKFDKVIEGTNHELIFEDEFDERFPNAARAFRNEELFTSVTQPGLNVTIYVMDPDTVHNLGIYEQLRFKKD